MSCQSSVRHGRKPRDTQITADYSDPSIPAVGLYHIVAGAERVWEARHDTVTLV